MIIAYASLSGKVRDFSNRLEQQLPECKFVHIPTRLRDEMVVMDEPFILITYTWGKGEIPNQVKRFMNTNGSRIVAVAGSGERNWGESRFCKAAIDISKEYDIPLLHTFEKIGYDSDVDIVASKIKEILQEGMI